VTPGVAHGWLTSRIDAHWSTDFVDDAVSMRDVSKLLHPFAGIRLSWVKNFTQEILEIFYGCPPPALHKKREDVFPKFWF